MADRTTAAAREVRDADVPTLSGGTFLLVGALALVMIGVLAVAIGRWAPTANGPEAGAPRPPNDAAGPTAAPAPLPERPADDQPHATYDQEPAPRSQQEITEPQTTEPQTTEPPSRSTTAAAPTAQATDQPHWQAAGDAAADSAADLLADLTVEQKAGQVIVASYGGTAPPVDLVVRQELGGVIVMSDNIADVESLASALSDLRSSAEEAGRSTPSSSPSTRKAAWSSEPGAS